MDFEKADAERFCGPSAYDFDAWQVRLSTGGGAPEPIMGAFCAADARTVRGRNLRPRVLPRGATHARGIRLALGASDRNVWRIRTRPELLFRLEGSGSQIFSVTYDTTDGAFRASKPAVWGPSRVLLRSANGDVSLHPDGNRIAGLLMASMPERESTQPHVVLVTRFFDELRATRANRR